MPPCFGSIDIGPASPCHDCAVAGMCARRFTRDGLFGVMVWPRFADQAAPAREAPDPVVHDREVTEKVNTGLFVLNLHYVRCHDAWYYAPKKKKDKEAIFRVVEASRRRVELAVLVKNAMFVSELKAAQNGSVEVVPYFLGTLVRDQAGTSTVATPRNSNLQPARCYREQFCNVRSDTWEGLAELARAVLKSAVDDRIEQ